MTTPQPKKPVELPAQTNVPVGSLEEIEEKAQRVHRLLADEGENRLKGRNRRIAARHHLSRAFQLNGGYWLAGALLSAVSGAGFTAVLVLSRGIFL